MSVRRCSQCGQEGHNRRNMWCPVNVGLRARADRENQMLYRSSNSLLRAEEELSSIVTMYEQVCNQYTARKMKNYVLFVGGRGPIVLQNIVTASSHYNINILLDELRHHVQYCNDFIRSYGLPYEIQISDDLRRFELLASDPLPGVPRTQSTSDYWKAIQVVIDLTISQSEHIECPICYETISCQEALNTNCKHQFCVNCVTASATQNKYNTNQPTCFLCRQTITCFTVGQPEICTKLNEFLIQL